MGKIKTAMLEWMRQENLAQEDLDNMENVNDKFIEWAEKHFTPEQTENIQSLLVSGGNVSITFWPESQGCIGCPFAGLVLNDHIGSSVYVCLARYKEENNIICKNIEH